MTGFAKQPTMLEQLMNFSQPNTAYGQMDYLSQLQPVTSGMDTGMGAGIGANANGSWWDSLFDKTDAMGNKTQGMAMPLINGASALMSGILGYKQFGLQKDAQKQSMKEWNMNWGAQQKTVNSQLEDRQRARVASNPNAYVSVGDYMKKNGI